MFQLIFSAERIRREKIGREAEGKRRQVREREREFRRE